MCRVSQLSDGAGVHSCTEEPLLRAKKAIVARSIGTEKGAVGSGFFIPSSNGLRLITCELMHSL